MLTGCKCHVDGLPEAACKSVSEINPEFKTSGMQLFGVVDLDSSAFIAGLSRIVVSSPLLFECVIQPCDTVFKCGPLRYLQPL